MFLSQVVAKFPKQQLAAKLPKAKSSLLGVSASAAAILAVYKTTVSQKGGQERCGKADSTLLHGAIHHRLRLLTSIIVPPSYASCEQYNLERSNKVIPHIIAKWDSPAFDARLNQYNETTTCAILQEILDDINAIEDALQGTEMIHREEKPRNMMNNTDGRHVPEIKALDDLVAAMNTSREAIRRITETTRQKELLIKEDLDVVRTHTRALALYLRVYQTEVDATLMNPIEGESSQHDTKEGKLKWKEGRERSKDNRRMFEEDIRRRQSYLDLPKKNPNGTSTSQQKLDDYRERDLRRRRQ